MKITEFISALNEQMGHGLQDGELMAYDADAEQVVSVTGFLTNPKGGVEIQTDSDEQVPRENWCCLGDGKGHHAPLCRYSDVNFKPHQVPPATPAPQFNKYTCPKCCGSGKAGGGLLGKCPDCKGEGSLIGVAAAPQPQEVAVLRPKQLIAVSFDPTQDASLPPKGRWIYLETALKTIDAVRKETIERCAERCQTNMCPDGNDICHGADAIAIRALATAHDIQSNKLKEKE